MAVKMRLRREGKRKQPFYRVVVADARSPRDGRFIEDIGYYQPLREPSAIEIKRERALYWLGEGVQPSDAVRQLLRVSGIWEEFRPGDVGRQRVTAAPAKPAADAPSSSSQQTPAATDDTADAAEAETEVTEVAEQPAADSDDADASGNADGDENAEDASS
ncbi:hypothetical protein BH23ACT10_BH23ACT10_00240 [soil metagenome]